ncbi:hypothetical protein [Lactiplantibacillus paraplantarum]|uniref:hypothetical protein n=1 Tax=Lactiplantibacillus paraplantarum TaxID=60520 RepID=UPI0023AA2C04|nr:hypothetical protein [Lactiplantibacillus paraplantarum]WEE35209.1 hypothetical protein PWO93_10960 [Lactiplantibacillus paraplantarum]
MKNKLINFLTTELSAWPVLIIAYYAITAKPTGQWQLIFNLPVSRLISSYLIAFPLLLANVPKLRHNPLKMRSLSVQASLKYHSRLNERAKRWDDEMNLAIFLFKRGSLMLFSEPLLLFLMSYRGMCWLHHFL